MVHAGTGVAIFRSRFPGDSYHIATTSTKFYRISVRILSVRQEQSRNYIKYGRRLSLLHRCPNILSDNLLLYENVEEVFLEKF